jgi:hypothetical protein
LLIADPISGLAGEREDLQGRQGDGTGVLVGFHQLRHQFISLLEFLSFISFISSSALFG